MNCCLLKIIGFRTILQRNKMNGGLEIINSRVQVHKCKLNVIILSAAVILIFASFASYVYVFYTAYAQSFSAHNNVPIKYVSSSQGKRICEVPQASMNIIEMPCDQNRNFATSQGEQDLSSCEHYIFVGFLLCIG